MTSSGTSAEVHNVMFFLILFLINIQFCLKCKYDLGQQCISILLILNIKGNVSCFVNQIKKETAYSFFLTHKYYIILYKCLQLW